MNVLRSMTVVVVVHQKTDSQRSLLLLRTRTPAEPLATRSTCPIIQATFG
jgi:hypothetical protein